MFPVGMIHVKEQHVSWVRYKSSSGNGNYYFQSIFDEINKICRDGRICAIKRN